MSRRSAIARCGGRWDVTLWSPRSRQGRPINDSRTSTPVTRVVRAMAAEHRCGQGQRLQLPEATPLVMTDETPDADQNQSSWKRSSNFASEYLDKRAQASYPDAYANTTSPTEKPSFASRYSDPTHPVNPGSPVDLLTGGMLNLRGDAEKGGLLSSARDLAQSRSNGARPGGLLERATSNLSGADVRARLSVLEAYRKSQGD